MSLSRTFSMLIIFLVSIHSTYAQIIINEVQAEGTIEIKNIGSSMVNINDWWLCDFPSYEQISDLNIASGNVNLEAGEILVIDNFNFVSSDDGEMALYSNSSFPSASGMESYVEWGSTGHQRSSVAVAAGVWVTGDFVSGFTDVQSIENDGMTIGASGWAVTDSPTIGLENGNVIECDVESGTLMGGPFVFCVDGEADHVSDVQVSGNSGTNSQWVITDEQGTILGLPGAPELVNFDEAGAGICYIYHLSHDEITGLTAGENINNLGGCFELSNLITVTREIPDGGTVTLLDGSTSYSQCAGQIVFDVMHTTTAPNLSYWYVITDSNDNILAFQNSTAGSTLDLSAAPAGECRVWGWNYRGLGDPIVGENISTLNDDFCEDISDEFITVYREIPDGGTVTLLDGSTSYSQCAGQIVFDVMHTTTAPNLSYWYVITDSNDNILAFQNSTAGSTLDLSAAPAGECRVWGWNYKGLGDPIMGENINTLSDDFCEDISDEFITVYRETPDGGTVTLLDGSTSYSQCAGQIVFDVMHTTTAPNLSYWYVITDSNDNILAFQNSTAGSTLDLSAAPTGECRVWGWNYKGLGDPIMGENINTLSDDFCEDISDEFITVYRETPDGGTVTLLDGSTSYSQCAGQIVFDVMHTTTAPNLSYWYVITDSNDNILAFQNSTAGSTLDLSAAPAGECRVWGWNYKGLGDPIMGENINTLSDDFCEDISDEFITVYREIPDGGTVTLLDGSTSYSQCAGQIVFDVMHTTTAPNLSYWYVITDSNDNILAFQNSTAGSTLDLSAAPAGECRVWGWNYKGLGDPIMGENINTLSDDFCEDISDEFITVYREIPDGGTITLSDGSNEFIGTAGDIMIDVIHTTTAANLSYWYIITDSNDNILEFQNSTAGGTLDLSAAPVGECRVWGWNYKGLEDPVAGENINTLNDDFCEAISEEFITVIRQQATNTLDVEYGEVSVYPNPTSSIIHVSFDFPENQRANQIRLIDAFGRVIISKEIGQEGIETFNLSEYAKGIYFVQLNNQKSTFFKKILLVD